MAGPDNLFTLAQSIAKDQTSVIFSLISMFTGKAGYFLQKNPAISKQINIIQGTLFTLIGLQIPFIQKLSFILLKRSPNLHTIIVHTFENNCKTVRLTQLKLLENKLNKESNKWKG